MFERFTHQARAVVADSQRQARRLGHDYTGCEHLLLAVASVEHEVGRALRDLGVTPESVESATLGLVGPSRETLDRDALSAIGIDLDLVQQKVEAIFGPNALTRRSRCRSGWRRLRSSGASAGDVPFAPGAKKCLELSLREALALRHRHIGVEHIALALTAMADGLAPRILTVVGVSEAQVRRAVLHPYREAG